MHNGNEDRNTACIVRQEIAFKIYYVQTMDVIPNQWEPSFLRQVGYIRAVVMVLDTQVFLLWASESQTIVEVAWATSERLQSRGSRNLSCGRLVQATCAT